MAKKTSRPSQLVCCEKPMERYDSMFGNEYYSCKCGWHATKFSDNTVRYSLEFREKLKVKKGKKKNG